ncbi:MAG: 2-isopropylmalate synthase [Marinilabiliaceae bacterium]|nr:2-isopropylmalate synthase [Marinilabiliaceae bacterium]
MPNKVLEILDTTLRDGEQTAGVSFNANEKLTIAKLLLDDIHVDRVEVASARVSEGELAALKSICSWAKENGYISRVETLGFVDDGVSINWISGAGCQVMNLLTKGSLKHVLGQLHKTPEQHIEDIKRNVALARERDMKVNIYLEDWSNGMLHSPEYVYQLIDALRREPISRFMLPDTLGVLSPDLTEKFCLDMVKRYPELKFDFHAHNDYDMAVANVYSALKAGITGVHTTVNGLGERAGNTPLASVIGLLNDHLHIPNSLREIRLTHLCRMVESISGIRIPDNKPLVGDSVFTQCAGIHADGDNKDNLYFNQLLPERFGRVRKYALGKTSGKASIAKNLEELGIHLTPEQIKKVTQRVIELGDKKESMTTEDLPFIIADVLKNGEDRHNNVHIVNYNLTLARGLKPVASLRISIKGKEYEETSIGDGQYDAFMKALWKIYERLGRQHPVLVDYNVSIPPGGKTDALVETVILWQFNEQHIKTRGLDVDQTEAAIKATIKMLNMVEPEFDVK